MAGLLDDFARLVDASGAGVYDPDGAVPDGSVIVSVAGMPPVDGDAIAVTTYGGPEPDSRNGTEHPRLQVRVRSADPNAALDLDRAIFDHLQGRAHETLTSGAYLQDCYALQSAPAPMGQDRNGRWEYARNYQLTIT